MRISPPVGSFGQVETCVDQCNVHKDLAVSVYNEAFFRLFEYYPTTRPILILMRSNHPLRGRGQGSKQRFTPLGTLPGVVMAERAG